MKVDVISVVVIIFCLCVCVTLALQSKTLFGTVTAEVVVKTPDVKTTESTRQVWQESRYLAVVAKDLATIPHAVHLIYKLLLAR